MSERNGPGVPVGAGALAGVAAWLGSYLVTYAAVAPRLAGSLYGDLLSATGTPTWKAVGWVFFNAHRVAFSASQDLPFGAELSRRADFLATAGGDAWLLYLLPPAALLAAGGAVVRYGTRTRAVRDGVLAGATVLAGYLPLTLAALYLVRITGNGTTAGPDPLLGVVLAGVLYPLAFGALGGAAAVRLD